MARSTPKSQSDKIRDQQEAAQKAKKAAQSPERKDDGAPVNNLQAILEAEERGLHRLLADLRPLIADVDAASAIVKTKREAVNKRMDQGVADGFPKGMVREILKEMAVTGARKDVRQEWEMLVRFRTYVGLPAATQTDLEARMPDAAKDEFDWRGSGYTAGLRGSAADPKADGCPQRFEQAWLEEYHKGQEKNALALSGDAKPKAPAKGKGADLGAETLKAIAEAEPEIVEQVKQDADLAGAEAANAEPV